MLTLHARFETYDPWYRAFDIDVDGGYFRGGDVRRLEGVKTRHNATQGKIGAVSISLSKSNSDLGVDIEYAAVNKVTRKVKRRRRWCGFHICHRKQGTVYLTLTSQYAKWKFSAILINNSLSIACLSSTPIDQWLTIPMNFRHKSPMNLFVTLRLSQQIWDTRAVIVQQVES